MPQEIDQDALAARVAEQLERRAEEKRRRETALTERRATLDTALARDFPALRAVYGMQIAADGQAVQFAARGSGDMALVQLQNGSWLLRPATQRREYAIASETQLLETLTRIAEEREAAIPRITTAPNPPAETPQPRQPYRFQSGQDVEWPQ